MSALVADLGAGAELKAQAMQGRTRMGYRDAGRPLGRQPLPLGLRDGHAGRSGKVGLAVRADAFDTRNRGSLWDDEYDEHGWSAMIAAKREWGPLTGLVELLHVWSKRERRANIGLRAAPAPDAAPGRSANALVTMLASGGVYRSALNPARWCVDILVALALAGAARRLPRLP